MQDNKAGPSQTDELRDLEAGEDERTFVGRVARIARKTPADDAQIAQCREALAKSVALFQETTPDRVER